MNKLGEESCYSAYRSQSITEGKAVTQVSLGPGDRNCTRDH